MAERRRSTVTIVVLSLLLALTLAAGYFDHRARARDQFGREALAAATQGLVSLTSVDHQQVDADVQRILDSSTGAFRDDFERRAQSFADAARTARSVSVGTVTEAGVQSLEGDSGRVLVAMTVMTSNAGVPERTPRAWRTVVTVTDTDEGMKVSKVEFIP